MGGTMSVIAGEGPLVSSRPTADRWQQLLIGVVCMTMVANLQYGWTLFVGPLHTAFGWDRSAIQVAFTIFVVAETWLVPFEGYLVDLFGPKPLVVFGGLLVGIAWVMNSKLSTLPMLYPTSSSRWHVNWRLLRPAAAPMRASSSSILSALTGCDGSMRAAASSVVKQRAISSASLRS